MRIRVLAVEDSPTQGAFIQGHLEAQGFEVEVVTDLRGARAALAGETPPDVVVLDIELPDGSGLELLRQPAGRAPVPMVVLSSRQEELDRVLGLELGAEDYVIKPFLPRELATRVRRAATRPQPQPAAQRLDFGEVVIDLARREVEVGGDKVIDLTGREFDLVAYLAAAPGRVVSRQELMRDVWHSSVEWQSPKTVTEHVRRVRHKIERDPFHPELIVTVGRTGYRWAAADSS